MTLNLKIVSKSQQKRIQIYIVMLFLVMFSDTLWIRFASLNRFYVVIIIGAFVTIIGIHRCCKKHLYLLLILIVCVMLSMAFNGDLNTLMFYKISLIGIGWTAITKNDEKALLNAFIDLMLFITIFSLICMVFKNVIIEIPFVPTIASGSYGTKQLIFTTIKIGTGNLYFLRNQGPFWEPGAFQAYLNIAIILSLFYESRPNRTLEVIILGVGVASTISTTGFCVFALIVIAYIIRNEHGTFKSKILMLAGVIAVGLLAFHNESVNYLLFDKLASGSDNSISNATRMYSILQNVKGIFENPIFGIGPEKYTKLFQSSQSVLGAVSAGVNTTTSLSVWAQYGLIYFTLFNSGIIQFCNKMETNMLSRIVLIIALFIIFNTENMNYSLFFNYVVIFGLMSKESVKNKKSIYHIMHKKYVKEGNSG